MQLPITQWERETSASLERSRARRRRKTLQMFPRDTATTITMIGICVMAGTAAWLFLAAGWAVS